MLKTTIRTSTTAGDRSDLRRTPKLSTLGKVLDGVELVILTEPTPIHWFWAFAATANGLLFGTGIGEPEAIGVIVIGDTVTDASTGAYICKIVRGSR